MNTEWKLVPVEPTDEMEVAAENDYEQTGATFPRWKSAYAAMIAAAPPAPTSHPIPTGATGDRDWELSCDECNGSGHVFVKHQVAERKTDVQEFKEECEACEGRGFNIAFEDIPGIAEYVKSCRPAATVATGADGRSATYGMTLGERIAHVGGRTNAQSYTEFGSPMAVNALIQHVLRDLDRTRQDDDGAYQARYRLPGGGWSSWGHVVCGVKGHEQELRYLPGERRPSPAAGDALPWQGLTDAERDGYVGELVDYGTDFVAPLYSVVESIEKRLREKNSAQQGKGGEA